MDETGRHKGDFNGDMRAKQDGEGGGTGCYLKHQQREGGHWQSDCQCTEMVTSCFLVSEPV